MPYGPCLVSGHDGTSDDAPGWRVAVRAVISITLSQRTRALLSPEGHYPCILRRNHTPGVVGKCPGLRNWDGLTPLSKIFQNIVSIFNGHVLGGQRFAIVYTNCHKFTPSMSDAWQK
jgi:hypothetical protein